MPKCGVLHGNLESHYIYSICLGKIIFVHPRSSSSNIEVSPKEGEKAWVRGLYEGGGGEETWKGVTL